MVRLSDTKILKNFLQKLVHVGILVLGEQRDKLKWLKDDSILGMVMRYRIYANYLHIKNTNVHILHINDHQIIL